MIDKKMIDTHMEFKNIDARSPLTYDTIRNTIYEWRTSGTSRSEFNTLDQPGHLFFKVIFHFWNGDAYGNNNSLNMTDKGVLENGLLAPSWMTMDGSLTGDSDGTSPVVTQRDSVKEDLTSFRESRDKYPDGGETQFKYLPPMHNSAYVYLLRNDELERAEKLKQFITLLSNISTYSPWYFYEITGLDGILERPNKFGEENFKIEAPKQITIKCLPDSGDQRIATLLDLYRDVSYSAINNRWVLPGNMRRFDMSIYIFDSPVSNLHFSGDAVGKMNRDSQHESSDTASKSDVSASSFPVSYKCIELHDCEIDYNATKSGYSSLTNAEGFQQTFEVPISVGAAIETRYNQYMDRTIGDLVAVDLFRETYSHQGNIDKIYVDSPQKTTSETITALNDRLSNVAIPTPETLVHGVKNNIYGKLTTTGGSINLFKIVDDLTGNKASAFISGQLLGNLNKTSISDLTDNLHNLSKNISLGSIGGVKDNINQISQVKKGWYSKDLGNITGTLNK